MSSVLLQITNVNKSYHKTQVLDQVSLSVSRSEIVGLVGPNGVGKTTTIRIALGTLEPDSGKVSLFFDNGNHREGAQVGYMPEISPLFETYQVEDYLELISKIKNPPYGYNKIEIDEILSQFDLSGIKKRTLGHLSKGTKQRVGLAQAFLGTPDLLFLDEPLSGLDPIQSLEAKEIISKASRKAGILLSTHSIHDVVTLCQRAYLLNEGKIIELDLTQRNESDLTSQIIKVIKG